MKGYAAPGRLLALTGCALLITACAQKPQPVAKPEPVKPEPPPALVIKDLHPAAPEKHGIVAAHIDFINCSQQTIEYVMFKTTAFTGDGQVVKAKKSGRPNAWLRVAGPFAPGESSGDKRWDKVWQNSKLSCFRIDGVETIDIDGVVEYYGPERIALMPGVPSAIDCDGQS